MKLDDTWQTNCDHKCGLTVGGHNECYIGEGPGFWIFGKGVIIMYKSVGFTFLISSHFS